MLSHREIERRIPHQGSMCLLDQVVEWDASRIRCEASSHRAADNPLRAHGRLGIACGIEYAAQAMAVHGALLAEAQADGGPAPVPAAGYLAGVRSVRLHASRLDDVQDDLSVRAERMMGDAGGVVYEFQVHAGTRLLLGGRAIVILDAAAAAPQSPRELP
jgi:predicted hotdog family 3-hydroxylacyl-ACP dehydratase